MTVYNESNIRQLITDLIKRNQDDVFLDLKTSPITNQKQDFWLGFLNYLKNEKSYAGATPLRESTITSNSLYNLITNQADLNDKTFEDLFTEIVKQMKVDNKHNITYADSSNLFWNESINNLISYFIHWFKQKEDESFKEDGIIVDGNRDWKVLELVNADAGNFFKEKLIGANLPEWVIPWENRDNLNFYEVVESDIVNSVISNSLKMDYTYFLTDYDTGGEPLEVKNGEWIRLLMPQNNRRVEVLDLNRNFWVIGQVLNAISAYLFADDNPIAKMFKQIANETLLLWENVSYLWFALAAYYNTASSALDIQVLPVPPTPYQTQKKYDIYNITENLSEISNRFSYLIDKYYNSNLIILPEIRKNKYGDNGVRAIKYPGLLIKKARTNSFIQVPFENPPTFSVGNPSSNSIDCSSILYGLRLKDKNKKLIRYFFPFSKIEEMADTEEQDYYAIGRIVPQIAASIRNSQIYINNVSFLIEDVGYLIINGKARNAGYILTSSSYNTGDNTNSITLADMTYLSMGKSNGFLEETYLKGHYIKECFSYFKKSVTPTYTIALRTVPLIPIMGTKNDDDLLGSDGNEDEKESVALKFRNRYANPSTADAENNEIAILSNYAKQLDISTDVLKNTILYVGEHTYSLWAEDVLSQIDRTYYKLQNNKAVSVLDNGIADNDSRPERALQYRRRYPHSRMRLNSGAIILYPGINQIYEFKDYWWHSELYSEYMRTINGLYQFLNKNFSYFYKKLGEEISESNWVIRFVQICGGYNFVLPLNLRTSFKFNNIYDSVCMKIKVHLFFGKAGGKGTYAWRQFTRNKGTYNSSLEAYIPSYDWTTTESDNYSTLRKQIDNDFELIKGDSLDFEKFHDNGKNEVTKFFIIN